MFDSPKTLREARKYRYQKWAGKPEGVPYNPERCAWEVWVHSRGTIGTQCLHKPGHGPDNLYCKQHAKRIEPS